MVSKGTIENRMLDVLKFKTSMAEGVLEDGDDTILMTESRFSKFMKGMEDMIGTSGQKQEVVTESEPKPENELPPEHEVGANGQFKLFDTDEDQPENPAVKNKEKGNSNKNLDLLKQFTGMLSDKEAVKSLAASVTEKDQKTGQTYFKLPVENQDAVENILNGLGQLLKNVK